MKFVRDEIRNGLTEFNIFISKYMIKIGLKEIETLIDKVEQYSFLMKKVQHFIEKKIMPRQYSRKQFPTGCMLKGGDDDETRNEFDKLIANFQDQLLQFNLEMATKKHSEYTEL